jgi:predicted amidohydrolase YtcJ
MRARVSQALLVLALAGSQPPAGQTPSQDPCAWSRDLKLVNGRIHTMDRRNLVVAEVTIQEGRFAAIGKSGNRALNPCTQTIDLRGRTVVPGLIDNHNHIVLLGMRPGRDVRLDRSRQARRCGGAERRLFRSASSAGCKYQADEIGAHGRRRQDCVQRHAVMTMMS